MCYCSLRASADGIGELLVFVFLDQLLDHRVDDHDFIGRHARHARFDALDELLSHDRAQVEAHALAHRAVLVGILVPGRPLDELQSSLDELGRLCDTLGMEPVARVVQRRGSTRSAVILGEGGSRGAIAIATANRVLMLEHAIYSVISPEGAA